MSEEHASMDIDEEDESQVNGEDADDASIASDATTPVEVSSEFADSLPFARICVRMEKVWSLKINKPKMKVTDEDKKKYILPMKLLESMQGQSMFPLLRLYMPYQDSTRNPQMKEKTIAQVYCDALGFTKGTSNYEKLFGYTDPEKVPHGTAGDLSRVVEHVLMERVGGKPSSLDLGQINQLLDDLAGLKSRQQGSQQHEWRQSQSQASQQVTSPSKKKKKSINALREKWLRKILAKHLSPVEHKWLVRILLEKLEFGLGWRAMLHWVSPYSIELWNSHNSLKGLCDQLALGYHEQRAEEEKRNADIQQGKAGRWEPQSQPAVLGNVLTPMLSSKVKFSTCMTQIQSNHAEYLKKSQSTPHLTLKNPPISVEIKLDGERMVVHVQDNHITMLTRNGKWYSEIYGPVIGPSLRQALQKHDVNCMLDGEIEAWDNGRKELIPFGSNRTVANYRRMYMKRNGLLDHRDKDYHVGKTDATVMRAGDESKWLNQSFDGGEEPGKECWLQFIAFDLLYLDGPGAEQLFQGCGLSHVKPGSLIHLSTIERKQILYHLITEQPNEVEIVKTVVVRPNGDSVDGEAYFSCENPLSECGHLVTLLDSTQSTIAGKIPKVEELDRQRQKGRSPDEISEMRAQAVGAFYRTVVEVHRFEGLVLKDLAAPYILGDGSRKRHYWHKFKPDYEAQPASDIDVLILGGFYATGLRHSGKLSHFLVGVLDSEDKTAYMTLCNVNGASVNNAELHQIMKITGFQAASGEQGTRLGKWFIEDHHGVSLPDFISQRSLQRGGQEDYDGWKFNRAKNYPDVWIRPEDSVVLTIHGQELVESDEYSIGMSMRFARIARVRHESVGEEEKKKTQIETDEDLWKLYLENMRQRQDSGGLGEASMTASAQATPVATCRFLTPEENARKKKKRKHNKVVSSPSKVPQMDEKQSDALRGLSFTVFEGNYALDDDALEAREAEEQGWLSMAMQVNQREDVMKFILSHGGSIKVTADRDSIVVGGKEDDMRVRTYMKGIRIAKAESEKNLKTKKALKLQELAKKNGVLKWTFVFSMVYKSRILASATSEEASLSFTDLAPIKDAFPLQLIPKTHHYLARVKSDKSLLDEVFDLERETEISMIDLMRLLEELEDHEMASNQSEGLENWQSQFSDAPWMKTDLNKLYMENGQRATTLVCTPIAPPSHSVASALPLASAMGCATSDKLTRDTHYILCDMIDDTPVHVDALDPSMFQTKEEGREIISTLEAVDTRADLMVVSPHWIRTKWVM